MIGRHLENGGKRHAYVGLHFTLAVIIVLVPDDYATALIRPGLERLIIIFIGMAILVPILLVTHLAPPRRNGDAVFDAGVSE
jgi:hypothetical protein